MRVFIDTNIYLRFIEPTDEKLEALSSFRKNVKKQKIQLLFPQITRDELFRNIPLVMGRYTQPIKDIRMKKPGFPAIIRDSKIKTKVDKFHTDYPKLLKDLVEHYEKSVDGLIKTEFLYLVKNSLAIHEDAGIIDAAKLRRLKGNPPGKGGSTHLGDEIEWEIILQKCFDDDITIISYDTDWVDRSGDVTKLKGFLKSEWESKSDKNIYFYDTLSEYVRENIKDSTVSKEDVEAEKKVVDLDLDAIASRPTTTLLSQLASIDTTALRSIANIGAEAQKNFVSLSSMPSLGTLLNPYPANRKCFTCGKPVNPSKNMFYCSEHLLNDPNL